MGFDVRFVVLNKNALPRRILWFLARKGWLDALVFVGMGASGGQGYAPCTALRGVTPLRTPIAAALGL